MNISASIRYTTDDYWVIMRGEGLRNKGGAGYDQYPANAELLM
jgi:mannose-6-phosphate isomerase-like protein (cupin superfamily)